MCVNTCKAQFAPAAGVAGTTAMYKDSSAFINWASGCTVVRGPQDISNPSAGLATVGDSSLALGQAGSNGVVSLGDGGQAILTFQHPLMNGNGPDFAVFENSFSDDYLELGFVEVSSDGLSFFRFPATSNIQDTLQTGPFGSSQATKINNLAGKYRALYGTPFDLQELAGTSGLDINNITHIKIIDVVGCIQNQYATLDMNGNKINDPWSTPFASGGFDLDAVGVIHENTNGINSRFILNNVCVFPNPVSSPGQLKIESRAQTNAFIYISDQLGKQVIQINTSLTAGNNIISLGTENLEAGIYFITIVVENEIQTIKLIKL